MQTKAKRLHELRGKGWMALSHPMGVMPNEGVCPLFLHAWPPPIALTISTCWPLLLPEKGYYAQCLSPPPPESRLNLHPLLGSGITGPNFLFISLQS